MLENTQFSPWNYENAHDIVREYSCARGSLLENAHRIVRVYSLLENAKVSTASSVLDTRRYTIGSNVYKYVSRDGEKMERPFLPGGTFN